MGGLESLGFFAGHKLRENKRVQIYLGTYRLKPALFKVGLDPNAGLNLKRESVFLENSPDFLRRYIPQVFKTGKLKGKFWYIREGIFPGDPQTQAGTDFVMRPSFFTKSSMEWCLNLLKGLRKFSPKVKGQLKSSLKHTYYNFDSYRHLLEPLGKHFFAKLYLQNAKKILDETRPIYDSLNSKFLTHHELYGSQILSHGSSFKLIDWENIGWGNPVRDFATLYLRAFQNRKWQQSFLRKFLHDFNNWQGLYRLVQAEVILQSFGNLRFLFASRKAPEIKIRDKYLGFFKKLTKEYYG